MGHHLAPDLIVDLLFEPFHCAYMQVRDRAAGEADEMVVMITVRAEIVIKLPVRMDDFADDPSRSKFIQIAVNSRKAYAGKVLPQVLADLFRAYLGFAPRQEIEDGQPFRRYLEPEIFQHQGVIMEHEGGYFLCWECITGTKWKPFRFFHSSHIFPVVKRK